jgi:hypothetical protein
MYTCLKHIGTTCPAKGVDRYIEIHTTCPTKGVDRILSESYVLKKLNNGQKDEECDATGDHPC